MRILMVSEDLPVHAPGGLANHVLTLCKTLQQLGHHVDLMGNDECAWPNDLPLAHYAGRFYPDLTGQYLGWKEIALGLFNPIKRTHTAKRFALAIQRRATSYDVIHYHGHYPNIAKFIPKYINFIQTRHDQGSDCLTHIRFKNGTLCTSLNARACATCRTPTPNLLQQAISTLAVRRYRLEVSQGFRQHKTLFVSEFLKSQVKLSLGLENCGLVLHNFVDGHAISTALLASHPTVHSTTAKRQIFFIAAKLYQAKGIAALLVALSAYPRWGFHITIAGDGEQEIWLKEHFKNNIHLNFLGWQSASDTLAHAMQADAMIVPSICAEACPTTVLEGLALGKPVFALARGGTTELSIYQAYPEQLHLFTDIPSLANALTIFTPSTNRAIARNRYPDVRHTAQSLIKIYQLPPGQVSS